MTGKTTTIPLTKQARAKLQGQRRGGFICLGLAVAVTVLIVVMTIVLRNPAFVAFVPFVAYMAWCFNKNGLGAGRALKSTLVRYRGPWDERVVVKWHSRSGGTTYKAQFQVPGLDMPLTFTLPKLVRAMRDDGVTAEWTPGNGKVEYTTVGQLTIALDRKSAPDHAPQTT